MDQTLAVIGRYAGNDLELQGSFDGLRELAGSIVSDIESRSYDLTVPQQSDPTPYDHFLTAVKITQEDGLVRIDRRNSILEFRGSKAKLTVLAESILWFADSIHTQSDMSSHLHIEYYPDHYYLSPLSLPLVIVAV